METVCDNSSVGVIVQNELGETLLLNRARSPYGLAPPAGHVDEHGSFELAAVTELSEEVGLDIPVSALELVIHQRRINNVCRRLQGNYHMWNVYRTIVSSLETIHASQDETLGAAWYSRDQLQVIAEKTRQTLGTTAARGAQVLEPIWLGIFEELRIVE